MRPRPPVLQSILIDANLPYWLADSLRPIAKRHDITVDHVAVLHGDGIGDIDWLQKASEAGGALFITLDKHMRSRPAEVQALIAGCCVGVILASQWQQDEDHDLVARLLRRWPIILDCMKVKPPALMEFGWSWDPRPLKPWRGCVRLKSVVPGLPT